MLKVIFKTWIARTDTWPLKVKTNTTVLPVDMTPFATRMALGHLMEEVWMDIAEVDTTLGSTLFCPQATLQGLATIFKKMCFLFVK